MSVDWSRIHVSVTRNYARIPNGFRHCERSEAIHSSFTRRDGLLRFARNDGGESPAAVRGRRTPPPGLAFGEPDDRLQRVSSTPQPFGSIIAASGILGHPLSRVVTTEYVSAIS